MMNRTNLSKFLVDVKEGKIAIPGVHGGEAQTEAQKIASKEENQKFRENYILGEIKEMIMNNNRWLWILFGLLIALVIFLSILLWRKQDDKAFFFGILGGQGLSILTCINRLSYFYDQKRTSETFLYLYGTATPGAEREKILDEMIKFLTARKAANKSTSSKKHQATQNTH
ncbi:MAG TPA: hypothetical protein VKR53_05570 [Puia sp.]|nr:hypothetical protein [Puia sp.]